MCLGEPCLLKLVCFRRIGFDVRSVQFGREGRRAVFQDQLSGTSPKVEADYEWSSPSIVGPRPHQK